MFHKDHPTKDKLSKIEKFVNLSVTGAYFGKGDIHIQWFSSREGVPCEILKLGSTKWQKGRLRVQFDIIILSENYSSSSKCDIDIQLKFCPNEPEINKAISPLDDIRQQINSDLNKQE